MSVSASVFQDGSVSWVDWKTNRGDRGGHRGSSLAS